MTITEILPAARLLPASDKLRLIRFLAFDIDDEAAVAPLEHGRSYMVQTPQFEEGASEALLNALAEGKPH